MVLLRLPAPVLVAAFSIPPRAAGWFAVPRPGSPLAGIGVALAAGAVLAHQPLAPRWRTQPLGVALAAISLHSLVDGSPEEPAFRGVITARLLPRLGRPGSSLVAFTPRVWSLVQVPSLLARGRAVARPAHRPSLLAALNLTGLMFADLEFGTPSIWPGIIRHASVTGFAAMFAQSRAATRRRRSRPRVLIPGPIAWQPASNSSGCGPRLVWTPTGSRPGVSVSCRTRASARCRVAHGGLRAALDGLPRMP